MKYKDYYAALGVPRDADAGAIKKAYRKLARRHHPDMAKEAGDEERFKEVAEAYATLKDAERRAAYDALGERRSGEEFRPPPQWQQQFADGEQAFGGVDLADLVAAMARGPGAARPRNPPLRGRDFEATVRLTLAEAHGGTTVNMDVEHEDGSRTLAVTVPAGVTQGQRLRLRGKGGPGRGSAAAGDIYLHIVLAPHALFRVDGHDLYFDLVLSPWEAALGADIEVDTLQGPVVLTVPAGTQSARKLRLRGHGMANGHGGRGDLYAVVRIEVPASLTTRERELFEELSRASAFRPRAFIARETADGHPHA